ncbi:hypothetical protein Leryth_009602 [Lithospermum erythrorhizon]|nr:hypothetical protein Leryth_009602 [Lithospermum erythrorhizon]
MASSYLHIIFILLCYVPLSLAQSNSNIGIGSSRTAGDGEVPWTSPSGDFAFGFKELQKDEFLLSIWYDKIPQKTVVWHANVSTNGIGNPILPKGSTIQVDAQTGLVLRDPRGRRLWNTASIVSDVARAFLNDTGNLVLSSSDNTSLWESFQYPTDTLLPSQELEIDGMLISRRSETNFSQGRFYIVMQSDGNFLAYTKSLPGNQDYDDEYYNTGTVDTANPVNSGSKVVFDERANFYVLKRNNETIVIGSRSVLLLSDYYHRVTLDFDGVLTHYYYPKSSSGNATWTVAWTQPDNICLSIDGNYGSGACGYNSFCRLNTLNKPVCQCPNGYSLVNQNDEYGSCQPDFSQSCDGLEKGFAAEDIFNFQILDDTDWPKSDLQQISPSSEEECRSACLQDCFCAVAIYRSNSCWKKKLPLSNGRIDTSLNSKAFIKYRIRDAPLPKPESGVQGGREGGNDRGTLTLIVSVLLGSSVFINVLLVGTGCLGFYLIYQKKIIKHSGENNLSGVSLRCFTFRELEEATNGFREEIGRGAFGVVFKGVMPFGSTVAVKKLDSVARNTEKEFRTEVNVIGQTHHKNLVRLIGFCDEEQNRLLVYEYMSNGTLASFIFGEPRPSWSQRTKIALGVARGLNYLHEECRTQIIHCDIKPQNVLLDEYYNARISDFGLAKLLMLNQSRTNTGIRGTKGYVAPEWFRNTQISTKVDVYSFGVVMFEIMTCRGSLDDLEVVGEDKFVVLTDWAWDCYQDGRLDELVGMDMEALDDLDKLERYVMVGLWCIQENASSRPTMRMVTQMLEGTVEVTSPPCPYPSFSTSA